MHELTPHTLDGLTVVAMPTVAAFALADPAEVVRLLEVAIWEAEALPCKTVVSFRNGHPVSLLDDVTIPAGYVPVYGLTAEQARLAAQDHAHHVSEAVADLDTYQKALGALAEADA